MFARIERFNLSQGLAEVAEELSAKVEAILRVQDGFRSLTLLADESSGEYLFLTFWERLEDIAAFDRSREEWRLRDIMSPYLTAVPQIEVYQLHNLPPADTIAPAGAAEPIAR